MSEPIPTDLPPSLIVLLYQDLIVQHALEAYYAAHPELKKAQ